MMKVSNMFLAAGVATLMLVACGNGRHTATDSLNTSTDSVGMGTGTVTPADTAPAAQTPPGAINPGEDSARYGTGAGDSSKNRPRR
ncbi:hypothetical protein HGH93_07910 [Chitinophaga polysaccharea]|uniref:hypothetical protein n=1 Tax=Chitinophaga TaxID=79328 RepID=UPI001455A387|nr:MULTISPECIES: hypothetical protein [Chitinophaga]NLR58022.1 hypothetical protein [Chitinophaga polysaccharea]NLU93615.1 hypothetical protein [Chitinophaga sp. Ak27]